VVDVGDRKMSQLRPPDAGGVEHFQDGPVPHPDGIVKVRLGEDQLGLGRRERRAGQPALGLRELDLGRRVVQHVPLPRGPLVEGPDGQQPLRLGPERQRVPVGLAVVEQVPLVGLQHRPGYPGRAGNAPLGQPRHHVGQLGPPVADGARRVAAGGHVLAELIGQPREPGQVRAIPRHRVRGALPAPGGHRAPPAAMTRPLLFAGSVLSG
jgi:hypothetical protein